MNASQVGGDSEPERITAAVSLSGDAPALTSLNELVSIGWATASPLAGPSDLDLAVGVACLATATPYPVDPSSANALLGDVVLICENTHAAAVGSSLTLDVGLYLYPDYANDGVTGPPVLVVNENDCGTPATDGGTFDSCGAPDPTVQDPQTAVIDQSGRAVWRDLVFPVPALGQKTTIRLKGMRADIAGLVSDSPVPLPIVGSLVVFGLPLNSRGLSVGVPLGVPAPASNQDYAGVNYCHTLPTGADVREIGLSELLGDIRFDCVSVDPLGQGVEASEVVMDVFATLNVNVTNNVGFGPGANVTDAVLVINENHCTSPAATGGVFGGCGSMPAYQDPQFGVLEAPNQVVWRGVHVPVGATSMRIMSLRANAVGLAATPDTTVRVALAMSDSRFSVDVSQLTLGVPTGGLISHSSDAVLGDSCQGGSASVDVTVQEASKRAFLPLGNPPSTVWANQQESGYFAPGSNQGGGASHGTRVLLRFFSVPEGVTLQLPRVLETADPNVDGDGLRLEWVSGADGNGAGGSPSSAGGEATLAAEAGLATAVYEVADASWFSSVVDGATIQVQLSWLGDGLGDMQVQAYLAPLSSVGVADFDAPEPRFVEAGSPATILSLPGCPGGVLGDQIGAYSGGAWKLDRGGDGALDPQTDAAQFGFAGATPITGDWNGDGRDEVGVFKDGFWYLDYDGDGLWDGGVADKAYEFGWPGVTPFVGDWNGDGRDTIGIYINGFWFLDADGDGIWDGPGVDIQAEFGWNGVTPLVGDWNGDGRDKIGIFASGFWYLDYNGSAIWDGPGIDRQADFGWTGVTPLVADWNGGGRAKIGIFVNGFWYLDYNGNALWDGVVTDRATEFGWTGVTPLAADWNGDGRDKIGVFVDGQWYLDYDGSASWDGGAQDKAFSFGQSGDAPRTGRW